MKQSGLKPGELRILKALEKGEPLIDKEIREKASLSSGNRRIRYLRNLYVRGLITRDIWTRKYSITDKGREMLRLVDQMKILLEEKEGVDISRGKVNG